MAEISTDPVLTPSPELEAAIDQIVARYPEKRSASLMVLHALQEEFGFLPQSLVEWTAAKLELEPINIHEIVTFYPMFRPYKVGKKMVRVCRTLSCALGGSKQLHQGICERYGLDPEEGGPQTSEDGEVTVEFAECLASCGTAPVMMVDDRMYESVKVEDAQALITGGVENA